MLTAGLAACALLAGLAGAWSPCGFSMVETLAPAGYAGRLRTTGLACAAFTVGALAGGAATFGGLAAAGAGLGAGGAAVAVAVAALLAGALGDAAGRRIVPQVRRQVPESWRRVLPVPLAAGLYGVLLGLGVTTFILSFAVWALAAACLALGDPAAGLAVGVAFGVGRAVPVVALAPAAGTERGAALAAAMAERPEILRGLRAAGAAVLAATAIVLAGEGTTAEAQTSAATVLARPATDPGAAGDAVVWQVPSGGGVLARGGRIDALPGRGPAVGGGLVAWRTDDGNVVVADAATLAPRATIAAPGANALAVSDRIVAWRAPIPEGGDVLLVADLANLSVPPRAVERVRAPAQLGRPALDGTRLAFHIAGRTGSRIDVIDLATGARRTVRRRRRSALLLNPSLAGDTLLHVRSTAARQQLRLGPLAGADRVLYSTTPTGRRDRGVEDGRHDHRAGYPDGRRPSRPARPRPGVSTTLWTTALGPDAAYLTSLRTVRGQTTATLLKLPR